MTQIFTALTTTPLYKYQDNSKAELIRLQAGQTATVVQDVNTIWLIGTARGFTGYIEKKRGRISDTTPNPPPVVSGTYCVVKHGFELATPNKYRNDVDWYFSTTPGDEHYKAGNKGVMARPCATRLKDFRPTIMNKAIQEMHFNVLKAHAGGMILTDLMDAYASIWKPGRQYNDHDTGTNFINKPNGDDPGLFMNPIVSDGAILKITGNATTKGYTIKNGIRNDFGLGEPCYPIAMMNAKAINLFSTPETHPWEWHRATIARREGYIWPYFQLEGADVWMPNLRPDSNVNWIACNLVRVLAEGEEFPSPYYPPR